MRGVLLDVDGTLIDSNDAHAHSWVRTFREFGYDIPFDEVRPLIGMGGDKLLPRLTGLDHESAPARRLSARRAELFREAYLPGLHAQPGARELVDRLREDGLRVVVATSAREEELDALLRQVGLDSLLRRSTSSDDADHSKPDPDIIHAALDEGQLEAEEAVMIGDTPYDVEAAQRAGVLPIALRCGGWDDRALGRVPIYDDPADLLRRYESSPLRRDDGLIGAPR